MKLFLQGDSGVGKSFMLRELFAPREHLAAGFFSGRITENGPVTRLGAAYFFGALPPPETAYMPLEEAVLQVERYALRPECKLTLLDEIGGVELASPVFMAALERILSCEKPCVGVFKSRQNLERMVSRLGLGNNYFALHQELEATLRNMGELITVTKQNREETRRYLEEKLLPPLKKIEESVPYETC